MDRLLRRFAPRNDSRLYVIASVLCEVPLLDFAHWRDSKSEQSILRRTACLVGALVVMIMRILYMSSGDGG